METFCSLFAFTRISPVLQGTAKFVGLCPTARRGCGPAPCTPQECSRCTRRAAAGLQRPVLAWLWQKECAESPREPRLAQQVGAGAGEAAPWLANASRGNTSQIPPAPTFYFCVF